MVQGIKTPEGVIYEVDTGPPINTSIDDPDNQRFKEDDFRMLYMKVLPCSIRHVHDWSSCNFTHPGEKARRRDPQTHSYTGIACPDMKKTGLCVRGDRCPYAHNVFEYWLHPTRYRSQLCNDGPKCRRKVCFFAHTIDELRVPPSKPFVAPDMLTGAIEPETAAAMPQAQQAAAQLETATPAPMPSPVKLGQPGQVGELPHVQPRSPVAAHEPPPVRNMSMSTASTSGSVELAQPRTLELDSSQSVGTYMSSQTVSFAPPEGFMDVDTSAVGRKSPGAADAASSAGGLSALQEVAASLANVKAAIKTGAADRNQVIDMLTNLLRETLQETTTAVAPETTTVVAPCSKTANAFAAVAPPPAAGKEDPFSTAAERSFDAPWPGEEAAQESGAGAASALGAAAAELSAELSLSALMGTKAAASLARGPSSSQPLAGRVPSREISLGAMPRQSSAPQTPNISARAAATSSHTSRTQLTRILEPAISKPPSGLSGSVGQQAQAAALQQQLLQQLQMRRAAQYGGGGAKGGAPVRPGAFPDLHTALEEYSRSGDISVLQGLSNIMGSSEQQNLRSLSADVRHSAGFATAAGQGTGLTARDLLYPDSFSDAYQYAMDPQGQPLGAQFLSAMEGNAPRAGSAPAYLNTSAANPLGGYGGYGTSMAHSLYDTYGAHTFDSAGAVEGAGPSAQAAVEHTRSSGMSAFEAGYLHAASAMGLHGGSDQANLPAAGYIAPAGSGSEAWNPSQ